MKISEEYGKGISNWNYMSRNCSPQFVPRQNPVSFRSSASRWPDSSVGSPNKRACTPESTANSADFSLEGVRIGTLEPIVRTKSLPKSQKKKVVRHDKMKSSNDGSILALKEVEVDESEFVPVGSSNIVLLRPLYKGREATVAFDYPPQCLLPSKLNSRCFEMTEEDSIDKPLYFKISRSIHTYNAVTNSFAFAGFKQVSGGLFNVYMSAIPKPDYLREVQAYQKLSHFPGIWQLGRKDLMWRNVYSQRRKFGKTYEICPTTYILPEDYNRIQTKREEDPKALWILKPANSSCGRGIKILKSTSHLSKKHGYVVSQYISKPHTIGGHKYDLRLYVCVTSFDPLRVYLYRDGLVRFATEVYTKKKLKKKYIHLTNFSVNKKSSNFVSNSDAQVDGEGSKWSLRALESAFREMGIDYDAVLADIEDVVIKALISVEPHVVNGLNQANRANNQCFETYGFDILLDYKLKPWLLEVNICPSLSSSSPIDKRIKTSLMCDVLHLVGIVPTDRRALEERLENEKASRLFSGEKPFKFGHKNIASLQACRRLEDYELSQEDLSVLIDYEEEGQRLGQFKRIFPTKENVESYLEFFVMNRYNNILLWKHLQTERNLILKYVQLN